MRVTPEDTMAVPARTQIEYLERLGAELIKRGLRVRLSTAPGRAPNLHVLNPDFTALTEDIVAESGADGWWFVWSWRERIGCAEDIIGAADRVTRVLDV